MHIHIVCCLSARVSFNSEWRGNLLCLHFITQFDSHIKNVHWTPNGNGCEDWAWEEESRAFAYVPLSVCVCMFVCVCWASSHFIAFFVQSPATATHTYYIPHEVSTQHTNNGIIKEPTIIFLLFSYRTLFVPSTALIYSRSSEPYFLSFDTADFTFEIALFCHNAWNSWFNRELHICNKSAVAAVVAVAAAAGVFNVIFLPFDDAMPCLPPSL